MFEVDEQDKKILYNGQVIGDVILFRDNIRVNFFESNSNSIKTILYKLVKWLPQHYKQITLILPINISEDELTELQSTKTSTLIKSWFFPGISTYDMKEFLDWLKGSESIKTLTFDGGDSYTIPTNWYYKSPLEIQKSLQNNPDGFFSFLASGGKSTFASGRIRTPMLILRSPNFLTIQLTPTGLKSVQSGRPTVVTIKDTKRFILPCSRYAESKSVGLFSSSYKKEEPGNLCGTFYYFEPDSTVFITFETIKIFKNKFEACYNYFRLAYTKVHGSDFNIDEFEELVYLYSKKQTVDHPYEKILILLARSFSNFMRTKSFYGSKLVDYTLFSHDMENNLPFDLHYEKDGKFEGRFMYAVEDAFDKVLCQVGRVFGVQIFVLTEIVSQTRVVTEILDTRSRDESLNSLAWLIS